MAVHAPPPAVHLCDQNALTMATCLADRHVSRAGAAAAARSMCLCTHGESLEWLQIIRFGEKGRRVGGVLDARDTKYHPYRAGADDESNSDLIGACVWFGCVCTCETYTCTEDVGCSWKLVWFSWDVDSAAVLRDIRSLVLLSVGSGKVGALWSCSIP